MYLILLVLVLPVSLFLIHINHWYYLKRVLDKHTAYIRGIPDSADEATKGLADGAEKWILAHLTEIKRRVNRAGLDGPTKAFMTPMGFGYVGQQTMDVLDNLLLHNREVLQEARLTLEIAKGHYLVQAKRSLSPLYWLEVLVFLPKEILSSAGIDATSKVADIGQKIAQIVYWLVLAGLALGYIAQR